MKTTYNEDQNSKKIVDYLGIADGQKVNRTHIRKVKEWLHEKGETISLGFLAYGDDGMLRKEIVQDFNL